MFSTQNYSLNYFRGLEDADDLDQSHDLECAEYSHFGADRLRPTIGHTLLSRNHGSLSGKYHTTEIPYFIKIDTGVRALLA
jgi:hypothetical protein